MNLPIVVTTSDRYLHLIPVFSYLFNKYWDKNQPVTIIGYSQPKCELPENFTFHSMGIQGDVSEWSTDLRAYFETIPGQYFIFLMEDCFIKRPVDLKRLEIYKKYMLPQVGRIDLTRDMMKRGHSDANILGSYRDVLSKADKNTNYRQSTQASIWNKEFLFKYLTPGLTPWIFEKMDTNDDFIILGSNIEVMTCNEGVRKHNPHELDLNGFPDEDVQHIKTLL